MRFVHIGIMVDVDRLVHRAVTAPRLLLNIVSSFLRHRSTELPRENKMMDTTKNLSFVKSLTLT